MKNIIAKLNKVFDNRVRLGIMSLLVVNDWVDFRAIKEMLAITDGQLASNIKALEKHEFIQVRKQFIGKKPNTSYSITVLGRKAFNEHLNALEALLKMRELSIFKFENKFVLFFLLIYFQFESSFN